MLTVELPLQSLAVLERMSVLAALALPNSRAKPPVILPEIVAPVPVALCAVMRALPVSVTVLATTTALVASAVPKLPVAGAVVVSAMPAPAIEKGLL